MYVVYVPCSVWSKACTPSLHFTALNTGVRLWVQQFWAMVVKRAINTFRYFSIIVSQLILPVVVSIIGIASLKSSSIYVNDPPRPLTLKESSPYTGIKMFYGDFGDVRAHQLLEVSMSNLFSNACTFYTTLSYSTFCPTLIKRGTVDVMVHIHIRI